MVHIGVMIHESGDRYKGSVRNSSFHPQAGDRLDRCEAAESIVPRLLLFGLRRQSHGLADFAPRASGCRSSIAKPNFD
jgi:hypothetical protein